MRANPVLEILSGDLTGRSYEVDEKEFLIGRHQSCHIVIPKRYVSRQHARICREGGDFIVDGLSEKNPVLIDRHPIREHFLSDGDVFEFCGIRFRFKVAAGKPRRAGSTRSRSGFGQAAPRPQPDETSWRTEEPPDEDSWQVEEPPPARKRSSRAPEPAEDSWQTEEPPPEPRRSSRGSRAEPDSEDSWETTDRKPSRRASARRSQAEPDSEDSWETTDRKPSRRSRPADKWDDESDSYETPVPQRGSKQGSVRIDDEEPDERTAELSSGEMRRLSGSGGGHRDETSNERTAELGKALDPDDPDYDPFAEVDNQKKKVKKVDPHKEKMVKLASALGVLGIGLAAVIYMQVTKPKPWVTVPPNGAISVKVDQVMVYEEPYGQTDPPEGSTHTMLSGNPNTLFKDAIAEVDWPVPSTTGRAILLIRGLETGETTFEMYFPNSRRIKQFKIMVGDEINPHAIARDARRAEMKKKPPRELKRLVDLHLASGETFKKEREAPGKEGYHRQALLEFRIAADAAQALRSKSASPDTAKLLAAAEDAESKAEEEHERFVGREFARYQTWVQRSEAFEDRATQLKRVLRGINHECDMRYKRLSLLLKETYRQRMDTDGSEQCEHDEDH